MIIADATETAAINCVTKYLLFDLFWCKAVASENKPTDKIG